MSRQMLSACSGSLRSRYCSALLIALGTAAIEMGLSSSSSLTLASPLAPDRDPADYRVAVRRVGWRSAPIALRLFFVLRSRVAGASVHCRTPKGTADGDGEADAGREAQCEEGPDRGEEQTLDRQSPRQDPDRARQAGCGGGPAEAQRRLDAENAPGALRGGQAPKPARPVEDGPRRTGPRLGP